MMILQGAHGQRLALQQLDPFGGGLGAGDGGEVRHAALERAAADRERVQVRAEALRRVDHHGDLPALNRVDAVRAALGDLVDRLDLQAVLRADTRPCRCVATSVKPARARRCAVGSTAALSSSRTLMKTAPLGRQDRAGGDLRLGEGGAEGRVDAHHLAGRLHLRAEQRVDAGELGEREHRLLHRDVRRNDLRGEAEVVAACWPTMTRAASLASGTPMALLTNGTVREARGFTSRM